MLYLLSIREIRNYGVLITGIAEDGKVHELRREYTPWLITVGLPKRFTKDLRKAKEEEETQLNRPFVGFTEHPQKNIVKFRTHNRYVKSWKRHAYEWDSPVTRQFSEELNLFPGWFDPETMTNVNVDDTKAPPNILIASYDIEVYSESRKFPDAANESDCVTMIATTFQRLHGGQMASHVLSLDIAESKETEHETIEQCQNEEHLLQRFAEVIKAQNPDVLIGYNIDLFDNSYVHNRLTDRRIFYKNLSRYEDIPARHFKGKWYIPGRVVFDLLPIVRAYNQTLKYQKRYATCKLDDVCQKEFDMGKTGFTCEDIFKAHETKNLVANQKLVEYNIRDCELVLKLQTKLQVLLGIFQLGEISLTPIQDVIYRGVSYRIMNMFSKRAHDAGFYLNHTHIAHVKEFKAYQKIGVGTKRRRGSDENSTEIARVIGCGKKLSKFQGAHCFDVVKAVHTDNVNGVDYASLYPSIIRRYNLDPTLLVLSPTDVPTVKRQLTDETPEDFALFAQSDIQAPIPQLLTDLTIERRKVKKLMKPLGYDSTEYAVLNARQLALKTMSNACYGFLGCENGAGLGHPELAAAVTAYGRDLIRGVAQHITDTYPGSKIVGGDTDSVYFTFPQDNNNLQDSFRIGGDICKAIDEKYGAPIELEFEKVYRPMCYVGKKMYAAMMFESPDDTEGKLDVKGLAAVKSNTSKLTMDLQTTIINTIMRNPRDAWSEVKVIVQKAIQDIRTYDKSTFIKSTKLSDNYKDPDNITQVLVAKKMQLRGQQEPQVGERVTYLVAKGDSHRVCDRADHPDFVSKENLDYDYYIDAQIVKPNKGIFDVLCKNWKNELILV
jgi:DNA polymerase elongation subunit (family B)